MACRRALGIRRELLKKRPQYASHSFFLARSLVRLSVIQRGNGQRDAGEASLREVIGILRSVLAESPDYRAVRELLADAWADLASLLDDLGRYREAADAFRSSAETRAALAPVATDPARLHREIGRRWSDSAEELTRAGLAKEALAAHDRALKEAPDEPYPQNTAAWFLVTSPDPTVLDPPRAVALARAAVRTEPGSGNYWNTLGVALYRDGALAEARTSLEKAMALKGGGGAYDWYFLAMIRWKMGEPGPARDLYDRASRAPLPNHPPTDAELRRFRAEAEALMSIPPAP